MSSSSDISRRKLLGGIAFTVIGAAAAAASTFTGPAQAFADNPWAKPSILVFDVNETLIDIESIGPFFRGFLGIGR
jgi:2-haloacid dehalogenase